MVDNSKLKIIEICNVIVENEWHIDWRDISDAFEFGWLLNQYPRLTRSQKWKDPDYNTHVKNIIFDAINEDKFRAYQMIEYILKNCTYFEEDELDKYLAELQGNKSYLNHNKTIDDELKDLIDDINESIASRKLVFALDRLHTLMVKYIKELCINHDIQFDETDRLDVIFKKYVNHIKEYIDSDMSLTILKSDISLFSQFNNIRNNYTYAHDNRVLSDAESKLIFKNIVNVKEFIDDLEEIIFD